MKPTIYLLFALYVTMSFAPSLSTAQQGIRDDQKNRPGYGFESVEYAAQHIEHITNQLISGGLTQGINISGVRSPEWFTIESARTKDEHRFFFDLLDDAIFLPDAHLSDPGIIQHMSDVDRKPLPERLAALKWMDIDSKPLQGSDSVVRQLLYCSHVALLLIGTGVHSLVPIDPDVAWWLYVNIIVVLAHDPQEGAFFSRKELDESDFVLSGGIENIAIERRIFARSTLWQNVCKYISKLRSVEWAQDINCLRKIFEMIYPASDQVMKENVLRETIEIFGNGRWHSALLLAGYTLRLMGKQATTTIAHYERSTATLMAWAGTTRMPAFSTSGFTQLAMMLRPISYHLFWPTAQVFYSFGQCWKACKKWYASRWEFSGLAMLSGLLIINQRIPAAKFVRGIATSATFATLVRNLVSFYVYAIVDLTPSQEEALRSTANAFGFTLPQGMRDRYYGRFCRFVSQSYLSWSAFFQDKKTASIIVGAIKAEDGPESKTPPPNVSPLLYLAGRNYMLSQIAQLAEDDPIATAQFKLAMKKAIDESENKLTLTIPPAIVPPLDYSHPLPHQGHFPAITPSQVSDDLNEQDPNDAL